MHVTATDRTGPILDIQGQPVEDSTCGPTIRHGMPSYFSNLSMFNAKKPPPHHHDTEGKTLLAFRRIVQKNE
jgi:hypothetical protein